MAKTDYRSVVLNILQENYQTLIRRGRTTKVLNWMDAGLPKMRQFEH